LSLFQELLVDTIAIMDDWCARVFERRKTEGEEHIHVHRGMLPRQFPYVSLHKKVVQSTAKSANVPCIPTEWEF
jgi:hypothetical protein